MSILMESAASAFRTEEAYNTYNEDWDSFSETSVVFCQTTRRHFLEVIAAVESSYFKITNQFRVNVKGTSVGLVVMKARVAVGSYCRTSGISLLRHWTEVGGQPQHVGSFKFHSKNVTW
jgi:hypothetical protein